MKFVHPHEIMSRQGVFVRLPRDHRAAFLPKLPPPTYAGYTLADVWFNILTCSPHAELDVPARVVCQPEGVFVLELYAELPKPEEVLTAAKDARDKALFREVGLPKLRTMAPLFEQPTVPLPNPDTRTICPMDKEQDMGPDI